jgi:DNA-binding PadR family transcriptional regulator
MAFCGRGRIKIMQSDGKEVNLSIVQLILLTILNQQPTHGYGVLDRLKNQLGGWQLKSGTVYPALHRLRDEGFISEEKVPQEDRPDAIEYKLTPAGKKILRAGLHRLRDEARVQDHFWRFMGTSLNGEIHDKLFAGPLKGPPPFGIIAMRRHCRPGHCGPGQLEFLKQYREHLERELNWVAQRLKDLKSSDK